MPAAQVIDLSPRPAPQTSLDRIMQHGYERYKQNQESDALASVYKEYLEGGRDIEKAIAQTRSNYKIGPKAKTEAINELLQVQKTNSVLAKEAQNALAQNAKQEQAAELQKTKLATAEANQKIAQSRLEATEKANTSKENIANVNLETAKERGKTQQSQGALARIRAENDTARVGISSANQKSLDAYRKGQITSKESKSDLDIAKLAHEKIKAENKQKLEENKLTSQDKKNENDLALKVKTLEHRIDNDDKKLAHQGKTLEHKINKDEKDYLLGEKKFGLSEKQANSIETFRNTQTELNKSKQDLEALKFEEQKILNDNRNKRANKKLKSDDIRKLEDIKVRREVLQAKVDYQTSRVDYLNKSLDAKLETHQKDLLLKERGLEIGEGRLKLAERAQESTEETRDLDQQLKQDSLELDQLKFEQEKEATQIKQKLDQDKFTSEDQKRIDDLKFRRDELEEKITSGQERLDYLYDALESREKIASKPAASSQAIPKEQQEIIQALRQDPEFQAADPDRRYEMLTDANVSPTYAKIESEMRSKQQEIRADLAKAAEDQSYKYHMDTEKQDEAIRKAAHGAKGQLTAIKDTERALNSGNISPKSFANIFKGTGPLGDKLSDALLNPDEAVLQASIPAFLEGRKELFGIRISDADLKILQDKLPSIGKTVEANKAILAIMKKYSEQSILKAEIGASIKKQNNKRRPIDYLEQIDEKMHEMTQPVKIISPRGQEVEIPLFKLDDALRSGGRLPQEKGQQNG